MYVLQNPGFDFSQATFNGAVPNPRTFMRNLDSVPTNPSEAEEEGEGAQ